MYKLITIQNAIQELQKGNMLIVIDDPGRENQADLFFPAELADSKKVNLMIQACGGLICAPITEEYAGRLELPLMIDPMFNTEKTQGSYTISVDSRESAAFGISASDRAKTLQTMASKSAKPSDLTRPGHIFPLVARPGGILERSGHTEAATELAELAGYAPCGAICEILNDHGEPAVGDELAVFAEKHNLSIVAIADLIEYRKIHPKPQPKVTIAITRVASSLLPTDYGTFQVSIYRSILDNREHAVLLLGDFRGKSVPVLTRVHSECLTGDTFSSLRCDCEAQLHRSMQLIQEEGRGVIIYLNQEGRGIGLGNKIQAYTLQDQGYDTAAANHELGFAADLRDYRVAAQILESIGVNQINLLTNNPDKELQLRAAGIHINQSFAIEFPPNDVNIGYLKTKKDKFGHRLKGV